MSEKISRRSLIKSGATLGGILLGNSLLSFAQDNRTSLLEECKLRERKLKKFSDKVRSGGPPPDGIPPIDKPKYVSTEEADRTMGGLLKDDSIVFGIDYKGEAKAYPRSVMVWHEIVNEEIDGQRVSITYCPLTGSAIGFKGKLGKKTTTFGTSGKLLNSNLVMYDRLAGTDSYWPQILGRSIQGPRLGHRLSSFPVVWTTWNRWKSKHPNTSVLTSDTGYIRAYGNDPYGSYQRSGSYYQVGQPMFEVMAENDRFPPKKVFTGIRVKDCSLAVPKKEFRSLKTINTELGGEPIVIVYEEALDTIRAFSRKIGGKVRRFERKEGQLISKPDGTAWQEDGRATEGPLADRELGPITFFDVMWFAWYAFYPGTEVLGI